MKLCLWCIMIVMAIGILLFCWCVEAAVEVVPVKFANPERAIQQFDRDPKGCVELLAGIMTQQQVDAFEAAIAPAVNEKLRELWTARKALKRGGLGDAHKVLVELDAEIEQAAEEIAALEDGQ